MAYNCKDLVKQIYADADQALIDEVTDRLDELKKYSQSTGKNYLEESRKYIEELRLARANDAYVKAAQIKHKIDFSSYLASYPNQDKLGTAAVEWVSGSPTGAVGGRRSVKSMQGVYSQKWMGAFNEIVESNNVKDMMLRGDIDDEVMKNLYHIGKFGDLGPVAGTSKVSYDVGKALHAIFNDVHQTKLNAGSGIGYIKGYMGPQTHDAAKLKDATFEGWFNDILPLLDQDSKIFKSKDNDTVLEKFRESYNDIINGKQSTLFSTNAIESKLSRERSFQFKDSDAFYEYNKKYGVGNLWETTQRYLYSSAKDVALMERLGPNIEEGVKTIKAEIKSRSVGDVKAENNVKDAERQFDNTVKWAQGITRNRLDNQLALRGQQLRQSMALIRFGAAFVSSLGDVVNGIGLVSSSTGKNVFSSTADVFGGMVRHFTRFGKSRKQAAEDIGLVFESALHYLHSEMPGVDKPGMLSRTTSLFYELSLLTKWTEGVQYGVASSILKSMRSDLQTPFQSLNPRFARTLKTYGIGERQWSKLQSQSGSIDDISDIILALREVDGKGADSFSALISDTAQQATLTPSDKTTQWLLDGTVAGTFHGEMRRNWAQAKAFAVQQIEVLKRIGYSNPGMKFDYPNVVGMMLGLTGAGTVVTMAKSLMNNEEFDTESPEFWSKSVLAGGGMGLIGDAIFNGQGDLIENAKQGGVLRAVRPAVGFVQGPVGTFTYDLITKGNKAVKKLYDNGGDWESLDEKTKNDLRRFVRTSVPGNNLPWITMGFKYLTTIQLREQLEPGYTERMQRELKDKGQLTEQFQVIGQ